MNNPQAQGVKTGNERDYVKEKDGQQLAVGFYNLHQGGIQVGRVLVVGSVVDSVEHWDLWEQYRQPSWANQKQEISFEYTGEPISVAEFEGTIGPKSTYIVAECRQVTRTGT
jgi:hypothetical protein